MPITDHQRQRSEEWRRARLGKITASRFADVLTEPRSKAARENGELSGTATSYLLDILAEILTGTAQEPPTTKAMEWGNQWEGIAAEVYGELTGRAVKEVGFVTHPTEPMIGGSPDRLVDDDGLLEIKCPYNTRIHLGYVLGGVLPAEHTAQVQGNLWVTGRKWADFISYDPRISGDASLAMAFFVHRVVRDDAFIGILAQRVLAFRDHVLEALCTIKKRGGSYEYRLDAEPALA